MTVVPSSCCGRRCLCVEPLPRNLSPDPFLPSPHIGLGSPWWSLPPAPRGGLASLGGGRVSGGGGPLLSRRAREGCARAQLRYSREKRASCHHGPAWNILTLPSRPQHLRADTQAAHIRPTEHAAAGQGPPGLAHHPGKGSQCRDKSGPL